MGCENTQFAQRAGAMDRGQVWNITANQSGSEYGDRADQREGRALTKALPEPGCDRHADERGAGHPSSTPAA